MKITALAPWFGSNRMLASTVGSELEGCSWVGVPFAGGMAELQHINARTIIVSDLHKHVINLARVVKDPALRQNLVRRLDRLPFHADVLDDAQEWCKIHEPCITSQPDLDAAENYFVACWMGRSNLSGTGNEFHGRISVRWNANGGDSNVRYRNAYRSLAQFTRTFQRCTFETMDAIKFNERTEDTEGHGLYEDPPFPQVGRRYRYSSGKNSEQEREFHTRLRDSVRRFRKTRVVMRFYDHPLIRELYPQDDWTWLFLKGRTQANKEGAEVLLINGESLTAGNGKLFA